MTRVHPLMGIDEEGPLALDPELEGEPAQGIVAHSRQSLAIFL